MRTGCGRSRRRLPGATRPELSSPGLARPVPCKRREGAATFTMPQVGGERRLGRHSGALPFRAWQPLLPDGTGRRLPGRASGCAGPGRANGRTPRPRPERWADLATPSMRGAPWRPPGAPSRSSRNSTCGTRSPVALAAAVGQKRAELIAHQWLLQALCRREPSHRARPSRSVEPADARIDEPLV